MNMAVKILVVFLSTFLALFLLLAIIVAIKTIQLLNRLKLLAAKADHIVQNVETASEVFKNTAGPLAFTKLFANIAGVVGKYKRGKHKDE
jgi:hypothetical protein